MPTKIDRSAPLPSAPFRFATLTSTTRWGGGQNQTPTTQSKRKVPNLFQDLTPCHKQLGGMLNYYYGEAAKRPGSRLSRHPMTSKSLSEKL